MTPSLGELRTRLLGQIDGDGEALLKRFIDSSSLLEEWLPFLHSFHGDRARRLLVSYQSAIVEAAGYVALGLGSAAMSAQRKTIELGHSWLYFADQPLFWRRALDTGSGFESRDTIVKFLRQAFPRFESRWEALERSSRRQIKQPYAFLSKHIHSQAGDLLHKTPSLVGLVDSYDYLQDLCTVQGDVAEYMHDTFASRFMGSWPLLPGPVQANLEGRLQAHLAKLM